MGKKEDLQELDDLIQKWHKLGGRTGRDIIEYLLFTLSFLCVHNGISMARTSEMAVDAYRAARLAIERAEHKN